MWIVKHTRPPNKAEKKWCIGYFDPMTKTFVIHNFYSRRDYADQFCNYMNGGAGKPFAI